MSEREVRLIDANALKEKAVRVSTVKEHCYMKAVGTHEIDKAPTIDPESLRPKWEWISVEDRLPDKFGFYLVASRYGEVSCKYFDWIGDIPIFEYKLVENGHYTHWMPLPEHPTSGAEMEG